MKPRLGIVFDIKKYSVHDGPGIRTTVFLKGCPMRCWWCHNPESQKADPEPIDRIQRRKRFQEFYSETQDLVGVSMSAEEVIQDAEKDLIFYDESGGGVTFSGGEPLMQSEFLLELLAIGRSRSLRTALDTSGYAPRPILLEAAGISDLVLYDLKLMDDGLHRRFTGVSNRLVLENLEALNDSGRSVMVRIPMIPDITDTSENIRSMLQFMRPLDRIRSAALLPYNPLGQRKYGRLHIGNPMPGVFRSDPGRIEEARRRFEESGFEVSVGG